MNSNVIEKIKNRELVNRVWKFEGGEASLPLIFKNGQFYLEGSFQIPASSTLRATSGQVPFGFAFSSHDLLLEDCYFDSGSRTVITEGAEQIWNGLILVGSVWHTYSGGCNLDRVDSLTASDSSLDVLFSAPIIEVINALDERFQDIRQVLPHAESLWYQSEGPKLEFNDVEKGISVSVSRQLSTSSGQGGFSSSQVRSTIVLRSDKEMSGYTLLDNLSRVEDTLSLMCFKPVILERKAFGLTGSQGNQTLLWHHTRPNLNTKKSSFHEILIPYIGPDEFKKIVHYSLNLVEHERVSLTMAIRSLNAKDALSRFLSIVQAFEVLARIEKSDAGAFSKDDFKKAIESASETLAESLPSDMVGRLKGLMLSSNRESFPSSLERLLEAASQFHSYKSYRPIVDIARDVNKARNTLVHVSSKTFSKLNVEASNAIPLGVELQFWYALIVMMSADIAVPRESLDSALVNRDGGYAAYHWGLRSSAAKTQKS